MIRIWKFLKNHPLSRSNHSNSILRFLKWQFASRTLNLPVIFPFVNNTRLIAQRGFSSGSGNYYVGLLEFEEMSFLLHYLRKEDCFVDVGANIGAYTVLASGAIGAECISIEPIPITFQVLIDNININSLNLKVHALNVGLSNEPGYLQFSSGAGSMNHVINASENIQNNVKVKVTTLDEISGEHLIEMIKIDVEGYEGNVVLGGDKIFKRNNKPNVIFMELRGHGSRYNINEQDIHNRMLSYGYSPYNYDPINRTLSPWTQIKTDILGDMLYIYDINKAITRVKNANTFQIFSHVL